MYKVGKGRQGKLTVAVILLALAACIASSTQAFRSSQMHPDLSNNVLLAPKLSPHVVFG